MTIKQLSKFDRYQRILDVCKGKVISCDIISDLVYIGKKSILLDTRILKQFGYLKESAFKISRLGRETKHYTTLINTLDYDEFEKMTKESAKYWNGEKPKAPRYSRNSNKGSGEVTTIKNTALEPLYQLLGLVANSEFKPLPSELITVYDINENKDKVNDAIAYDRKQSPRVYVGCSFNQVGW